LVGLICPEGFHVNAAGDGCIPNEFLCEEGYIINERRTACIPLPGTPVPFPFLIFGLCAVLVVSGSYLKERKSTKVVTSLILLLSSVESLEYILILSYSFSLEIPSVGYLALFSLIMTVSSNLLYLVLYKRDSNQDESLKEWLRVRPKFKWMIWFGIGGINFKLVRIQVSGLFNRDWTQAKISD
jgi:hypothetical protein